MNVIDVKKNNSNFDLANRFPMVFKLKKTAKSKIIALSILFGILFGI